MVPPSCLVALPDGRVLVGADQFYVFDMKNLELERGLSFTRDRSKRKRFCAALLSDNDPALHYFCHEASVQHDYPLDAVVVVDNYGQQTDELLLFTNSAKL